MLEARNLTAAFDGRIIFRDLSLCLLYTSPSPRDS